MIYKKGINLLGIYINLLSIVLSIKIPVTYQDGHGVDPSFSSVLESSKIINSRNIKSCLRDSTECFELILL